MRPGNVKVTDAAPIARICIDNPARRNAITVDMWEQLAQSLDALNAREDIRVVIVAGAGDDAFVSGADIEAFEPDAGKRGDGRLSRAAALAWQALDRFDKPLIAMIHGYCFGAGVALAAKADLRIASTAARFSIPAARLGLAYPLSLVRSLVALVGPGAAKSLLFSASRIDAAQALRIGLVDEVLAPDELASRVDSLADAIANNAPLSVMAAKASVDLASGRRQDEAQVIALCERCVTSADHAEGVAAFLAKRQPSFRGR